MPKIDIAAVPVRRATIYPEPFAGRTKGRSKQALGSAGGLSQFGVNLSRLAPGAASALKHWHENEDEFVFIVEGVATLIEGDRETPLAAGEAAAFKAGVETGHHIVNRSERDVVFLEIGSRASAERAHYPDDDLVFERINSTFRFSRRNGTPY
ncbi:MAG TPA: cupin domain-containing protein [Rhodobacteraceae bacterium]|nr:cupin domain-containing protein [Paracoccaceae bacterium]